MASLGLTLAREATIPIELAEEARSLLDKNPREWAPSLLYKTATGEKIKDTERRVSEFRAITKRFELPQQSAAVSAHFCNESVYGNLNVLCVTGVVRLDPNADVGGDDATPVTLDWPSEATRAAAKRARKKLLKGPANYPGPWND